MQLSTRSAFVAVALASLVSVSQAAIQSTTQNLGVLTSTGTTFGNSFDETGSFVDYYTFTIANPGTVSGTTTDTSYVLFFTKDVTLSKLVLTGATSSTILASDTTASSFTFSGLAAGDYKMAVHGSVTGALTLFDGSYSGTIKATSTAPVAAPVPEASDIALTAIGLSGVAFMVRRRNKKSA